MAAEPDSDVTGRVGVPPRTEEARGGRSSRGRGRSHQCKPCEQSQQQNEIKKGNIFYTTFPQNIKPKILKFVCLFFL